MAQPEDGKLAYRRILVPVWQGDQLFAVANLFEVVIPVTAAEARP